MIAVLIGYESVSRLFQPVAIHFAEAIPIACVGLAVNIASAWLLTRGGHDHAHHGRAEQGRISAEAGNPIVELHEEDGPARFRLRAGGSRRLDPQTTTIEIVRPDGRREVFGMRDRGDYLESVDEVPEPHAFTAHVRAAGGEEGAVRFEEHDHGHARAHRDNNMRAAIIHVAADAAVSVLVITGLLLARAFGWLWMDPLAGIAGACVIASWSYGLIRDTGAILLDMNPDRQLAENLRETIESEGDRLADLHLWRVGPGHVAAIISVATSQPRHPQYYHARLARYKVLSHVTVEVVPLSAR
jgi:cation diffusion facilitator family transporter